MQHKVVLMNRDLRVLELLFYQKVASLDTIRESFFNTVSRNFCNKRMQKLVKARLIGKTGYNTESKRLQIAYFLTSYGFKSIKASLSLLKDTGTFKSDSIEHDIKLSEIRSKLSTFKAVKSYYSENAIKNLEFEEFAREIKPYRILRSDAVLELEIENESCFVALEYERERKQESKYRRKIRDYYLEPSALAAFYICREESILKIIRKIDKEVSKRFDSKKIYTILEQDFQNIRENLPFRNTENGIFHI